MKLEPLKRTEEFVAVAGGYCLARYTTLQIAGGTYGGTATIAGVSVTALSYSRESVHEDLRAKLQKEVSTNE